MRQANQKGTDKAGGKRRLLKKLKEKGSRLLEKLQRRSRRRRGFLKAHLLFFGGVNLLLIFWDLITGRYLWFFCVTGAMLLPLLQHYLFVRGRNELQERLETACPASSIVYRPAPPREEQ